MSKATEQVYVRHQNRGALEDLRKHRQRLALELWARARPGHDFGLPIRQLNEDIAVIEGGPKRLVTGAKSLGQSRAARPALDWPQDASWLGSLGRLGWFMARS
jgi:hypothetical protein